ncbi:MAG: DNA-3-methyladenine glycosylase family protein [Egibacteraceae bacterium]
MQPVTGHRPRPTNPLVLTPLGPFSLAASSRFLEGFAPAGYRGGDPDHLHLAFPVEGDWPTVGACVRERDGAVVATVHGDADPGAVRAQVARILSLDVDGAGFAAVGRRDPVIGRLQRRWPGLRPVCFWSAYEAAAWALLSHRVRITQAAAAKQRIAERLGLGVDIHGDTVTAFPAPRRLRGLTEADVPGRKLGYLLQLADAALDGQLDSATLRSLPRDEALSLLRRLPGIGAFSAELVLLRGAGDPDHFPTRERRLRQAMARLYDLRDPTAAQLTQIADSWRPYRTWASVLLRVWLEDEAQPQR